MLRMRRKETKQELWRWDIHSQNDLLGMLQEKQGVTEAQKGKETRSYQGIFGRIERGEIMKVRLCWKTEKDIKERMINVSPVMTVKEAMQVYKEIEPLAVKAYLRRWDGWYGCVYKVLKREEKP